MLRVFYLCSYKRQVLLEGREATVNYVPTPYRYTLTMSDTTVLGQRRAAQRIAAKAMETVGEGEASDAQVGEAVSATLAALHAEI